jgi:hypothetical protein
MVPIKSKTRTWYDVQMAIAAIAMSLILALWNLFANPDREQAARRAAEEAQPISPSAQTEPSVVALTPAPLPIVKIIFGNAVPPQTSSSQASSGNNRGGGSTRSS